MRYETIIFDLDGTLVDSFPTVIKGFNYALSPFGIQVSAEEVEAMRTQTDKELFLDYVNEAQAKEALARLWEHSRQSAADTVLFSGVESLLEKISEKNINLGLWTGRDYASALNILKVHEIENYFKGIVGGCQVEKNKPDSQGLLMLADKMNVNLSSIIHVGDHEHDLLGANSAGVIAVHVKWSHAEKSSQLHPLANFTFDSIEDFIVWVDRFF
jgi:HAD superfamily hydrolase (TIGR01549 family)